ncbi:unnamed protein product, partial [Darwinula stevensoni]
MSDRYPPLESSIRFQLGEYHLPEWNFNDTKDHRFRLLAGDKSDLIVRDIDQVVKLSLDGTGRNRTDLEWRASKKEIQQCRMKGKTE